MSYSCLDKKTSLHQIQLNLYVDKFSSNRGKTFFLEGLGACSSVRLWVQIYFCSLRTQAHLQGHPRGNFEKKT